MSSVAVKQPGGKVQSSKGSTAATGAEAATGIEGSDSLAVDGVETPGATDKLEATANQKVALESASAQPEAVKSTGLGFEIFDKPRVAGRVDTCLRNDNLLKSGASEAGKVFHVGGDGAATMQLRLRQIRVGKADGVQVEGRVTPLVARRLEKQARNLGLEVVKFAVDAGRFEDGRTVFRGSDEYAPGRPYSYGVSYEKDTFLTPEVEEVVGSGAYALSVTEKDKWSVEFVPTQGAPQAWRHHVRVRAFGDTSAERMKNLEAAFAKLGVSDLLDDADSLQSERLRRLAVLRQVDPKQAETLGKKLGEVPLERLDKELAKKKIDAERMDAVRFAEVFPGHLAAVDPVLGKSYVDLGVKALMAGVDTVDAAVKILSSDGLMSSVERYKRGSFTEGASLSEDEESGGAEYAFLRMVSVGALKKPEKPDRDDYWGYGQEGVDITNSFGSGSVQLLVTGKKLEQQLSRTDWHAYTSDSYGGTISKTQRSMYPDVHLGSDQGFSDRLVGKKLVTKLGEGDDYASDNEVMFKSGVPAAAFTRAVVQNEHTRDQLIATLKKQGVKEIGGRKVEDFVVVAEYWHEVSKKLREV